MDFNYPPKLALEGVEFETLKRANFKISRQPLSQPQMGLHARELKVKCAT